jgi:hypothetical protein
VLDANGQALAYVCARETKQQADIAKVLTFDEARRIAVNVAKLVPVFSDQAGRIPRIRLWNVDPCWALGVSPFAGTPIAFSNRDKPLFTPSWWPARVIVSWASLRSLQGATNTLGNLSFAITTRAIIKTLAPVS